MIELNEAFAAQSLACLRELGVADDDPRVNPERRRDRARSSARHVGRAAAAHRGARAARRPAAATRSARCASASGREWRRSSSASDAPILISTAFDDASTAPAPRLIGIAGQRAAPAREFRDGRVGRPGGGTADRPLSRRHRREDRRGVDERDRLHGDGRVRDARRRSGAPPDDVPRARADAQGDRAVPDGAEGRVLSRVRRHRRDEAGFVGRHRGRHRDVLRLRVARTARVSERDASTSMGRPEALSKGGTFVGRHICVPLEGVAVHINAFNFPVWGMLEKLAPTLLAGMPAIVKPATVTSYLTESVFRAMIESRTVARRARCSCCAAARAICSIISTASAPSRSPARRRRGKMLKASKAISSTAFASTWKRTRSTTRCSAPTPRRERPSSISSSRKSCAR